MSTGSKYNEVYNLTLKGIQRELGAYDTEQPIELESLPSTLVSQTDSERVPHCTNTES